MPLARGTRNALALLEYAGRTEIPVSRGAARPRRGRFRYSYGFHSRNGLGRRLPNPTTQPAAMGAVEFLAQSLDDSPGGLTIIALGPLTNIALLLERRPASLERLKSLVIMGGAVGVPGNVTGAAEFNIHSDPYAANAVLSQVSPRHSGGTGRLPPGVDDAGGRRPGWPPPTVWAGWRPRFSPTGSPATPTAGRFEFYDPLTVAAVMAPEVMTVRRMGLRVELEDEALVGATLPEEGNPPASVSGQVDGGRFFRLLEETLDFRMKPGAGTP